VSLAESPPPKRVLTKKEKIEQCRRRMHKHTELLKKKRQEKEEEEERKLFQTSSIDERPFLFLPDETILLIFSFMPAAAVCSLARTCRRFGRIAKDEKLWATLCTNTWGDLQSDKLYYRNKNVAWNVTFKNNHLAKKMEEKLAALTDLLPCQFCNKNTARLESRQRNVHYIQWRECLSCRKTWNWQTCFLSSDFC